MPGVVESNSWGDLFDSFSELSGEEAANRTRAYNDLGFFSEYVMGYEDSAYREPSMFLKRIYRLLQFSNDSELLILGPRFSAKSQAVTVNYPLWELGRNPLMRFLLVFAAKELQGRQFSDQIASVIERNERYKEVFGDLTPKSNSVPWSWNSRTVQRQEPPGGLKGASVTIGGLGTNLPSMRADCIIVDDIVTQDNAYSTTRQDEIEAFIFSTLYPILEPEGKMIIVGSRWDDNDLYGRLVTKWNLKIPERDPRIDLDVLRDATPEMNPEEEKVYA